jgi:hypothetical protein
VRLSAEDRAAAAARGPPAAADPRRAGPTRYSKTLVLNIYPQLGTVNVLIFIEFFSYHIWLRNFCRRAGGGLLLRQQCLPPRRPLPRPSCASTG